MTSDTDAQSDPMSNTVTKQGTSNDTFPYPLRPVIIDSDMQTLLGASKAKWEPERGAWRFRDHIFVSPKCLDRREGWSLYRRVDLGARTDEERAKAEIEYSSTQYHTRDESLMREKIWWKKGSQAFDDTIQKASEEEGAFVAVPDPTDSRTTFFWVYDKCL